MHHDFFMIGRWFFLGCAGMLADGARMRSDGMRTTFSTLRAHPVETAAQEASFFRHTDLDVHSWL